LANLANALHEVGFHGRLPAKANKISSRHLSDEIPDKVSQVNSI
jgi:hypothetical protein